MCRRRLRAGFLGLDQNLIAGAARALAHVVYPVLVDEVENTAREFAANCVPGVCPA
jgi:hypothetical protein